MVLKATAGTHFIGVPSLLLLHLHGLPHPNQRLCCPYSRQQARDAHAGKAGSQRDTGLLGAFYSFAGVNGEHRTLCLRKVPFFRKAFHSQDVGCPEMHCVLVRVLLL